MQFFDMTDNIVSSLADSPGQGGLLKSWKELNVHSYVKLSIVACLFYWLFGYEINAIVLQWITDPAWSHGFLIPFFSLYFLNQRKQDILNVDVKPSYVGLMLLAAAIIFYPLNIVHFRYGYLNPLTVLVALGAVVLLLGGWKMIRYTWLPIAYLVFAIPLPTRYYMMITMPMRQLDTICATAILNLVNGIDANASGVVIDVFYKGNRIQPSLNVAEACSGMRLLMAFVALGVAMAYLHYRPAWQRIVLLLSTVPIAIFCNIVRVTVTGFIYILINPVYAQGIYHDLLGMATLPLAFGMYGLLAWFMSSLFEEETKAASDVVVRRKKNN